MTAEYLVYFTGPDLGLTGQFVDDWTALDIVLRLNDVDTIQVTCPASAELAELAQPGNRLEVLRRLLDDDGNGDWEYLTGGPLERTGDKDWSVEGQNAPPGQVVIQAADDRSRLAGRLTYPDPAADSEHQTGAVKRTFTAVNAKTVMRTLVNENAGPGALAARRVPQLALGDATAAGGPVTYSSRMAMLTDDLRAVALAGGGLIYSITRVPDPSPALLFQVTEPEDLSGLVVYSEDIGNLSEYQIRTVAPQFTVAIVGGDGTGTSRIMVEIENAEALAAGWERVERFISNDSTDVDELTAAGLDALNQAAEQGSISITAVDNADQSYGHPYRVGDVVGAVIDGTLVTAPITAVTFTVRTEGDDAGEVVSPQIGGQPITDSATLRKLRDLEQRLGRQERG
jgi:hypothetical protein